jgi:hypothetical protein
MMYSTMNSQWVVSKVKKLMRGSKLRVELQGCGGDIINTRRCVLRAPTANVTDILRMQPVFVDLVGSCSFQNSDRLPKSLDAGYRACSILCSNPTPSQAKQYVQNAPYAPSLVCKAIKYTR